MSKPNVKRIVLRHIEISFDDVDDSDFEPVLDPETLLVRKIESLAQILGCTEEEAQRVLFNNL